MSITRNGIDASKIIRGGVEYSKVVRNGVELWSNASDPELYIGDAAAIGSREVDGTNGWSTVGQVSINSVTDEPQNGSYHIAITSNDSGGTGDRAERTVDLEVGESYNISIKAREAIGSDARIQLFAGVSGWSTKVLNGSWTTYTGTVTANSTTMKMRFYPNNGSGNPGDVMYIDEISIQKVI